MYEQDWKICVPASEIERANMKALADYLNSIWYC